MKALAFAETTMHSEGYDNPLQLRTVSNNAMLQENPIQVP